MPNESVTTSQIAEMFGFADAAVARNWIRRADLSPLPERIGDAKLYDLDEVLAAKERMPGRGVGGGRPKKN